MCGCGREIIVFINASGVTWTWTIMFPIDLILAEEEDYLESVQATDELNMYSFYGSFSSSHDQHGCQPSIKAAHHPMPQSCGRVRGLGRNRQTVLASQNRADFVALELELGDSRNMQRRNEGRGKRRIEPWCFPISIMGLLLILIVFLPFINPEKPETRRRDNQQCDDQCRLMVVESIPRHLKYPKHSPAFLSTYSTWMDLIERAQQSIDIGSFYWDLRQMDASKWRSRLQKGPSSEGERIFKELSKAGLQRKIKIRIAQSQPDRTRFPDNDTATLVQMGAAEVRNLNFTYLLGSGVLHTKMWIIDNQHFWIGSANMDWKSLTEVKELGLTGINCSCLAEDLAKIFSVYWYLGESASSTIPSRWPGELSTFFNKTNPFLLKYNDSQQSYGTYMASSPPSFCPDGRTTDIDALLSVIENARKFVYIAVMDYTPILQDQHGKSYWPVIDDALRTAAYNRPVIVRLLVSKWNHTNPTMVYYLKSLLALNGVTKGKIEIKWFKVPAFTPAERDIPFARVNHNKYMLTETTGYIGTSNWEGSYFTTTAGVSIVINDTISDQRSPHYKDSTIRPDAPPVGPDDNNFTTVRDQLQSIFLRDWNSKYSSNVMSS